MCGIFGYAGDPSHPALPQLMSNLAVLTSLRGDDATGIAWYTTPDDKSPLGMWYHKESKEAEDWLDNNIMTRAIEDGTRLMIGHCRFATHGDLSEKNNHPHFTDDQRIAIVHNGVIGGYQSLDRQFNLTRTGECDSETIAKLVGHFVKDVPPRIAARKKPILTALEELDECYGDFAVAALDSTTKAIYLFRNHSNPLHYCPIPGMGITLFASDPDHIHMAVCDALPKRTRRRLGYRKDSSLRSLTPGAVLVLKRDGSFVYSRETKALYSPAKRFAYTPSWDTRAIGWDPESIADRYDNADLLDDHQYSWLPRNARSPVTIVSKDGATYYPAPGKPPLKSSDLVRHLLTLPPPETPNDANPH